MQKMTAVWCGVLLVLGVSTIGCSPPSDEIVAARCGELGKWVLPEELLLPPDVFEDSTASVPNERVTRARLNLLALSVEQYCLLEGGYPVSLDQLFAYNMPDSIKTQCHLNPRDRTDAWKRPFRYELLDSVPSLVSAGADGEFGTDDDIPVARRSFEGARAIDLQTDCLSR